MLSSSVLDPEPAHVLEQLTVEYTKGDPNFTIFPMLESFKPHTCEQNNKNDSNSNSNNNNNNASTSSSTTCSYEFVVPPSIRIRLSPETRDLPLTRFPERFRSLVTIDREFVVKTRAEIAELE